MRVDTRAWGRAAGNRARVSGLGADEDTGLEVGKVDVTLYDHAAEPFAWDDPCFNDLCACGHGKDEHEVDAWCVVCGCRGFEE